MRRSGLTLIEVLAATVLLSLLASAIVPGMAKSLALLSDQTSADTFDLSQLSDLFMADPRTFGFKDRDWIENTAQFEIPWPDEFESKHVGSVAVEVLRTPSEEVNHVWLVFQYESQTAVRWMKLPPKAKAAGAAGTGGPP